MLKELQSQTLVVLPVLLVLMVHACSLTALAADVYTCKLKDRN